MNQPLSPAELEDRLFSEMAVRLRNGEGPSFDLVNLACELGIPATPQALIGFATTNNVVRGNKKLNMQYIGFDLNADGERYAALVEQRSQPLTFRKRLDIIPRSDWISLAALIVSAIALLKPGQ